MTAAPPPAPTNTPRGFAYFDKPMLVRRNDATHYLWGDEASGQVNDIIYGKNENVESVIYTLPPGGYFVASDRWRPIFDQHRFYYVLQGELTIHDPKSGDIAHAMPGQAIHWTGNRWHFGYNFSDEETWVLDWFAPHTRSRDVVFEEEYKERPEPIAPCNGRYDLLGKWPQALPATRKQAFEQGAPVTLSRHDALHIVHGSQRRTLEHIYVSTDKLTAGIVELMPGVKGDVHAHPGEKVILATKGRMHVYLPTLFEWFELCSLDCLYLPKDTPHQYWNYSGARAEFAFQVVPRYR